MIAQTFSGSGRHDHEGILSGQDIVDNLFLVSPKVIVPKDIFELVF